MYLTEISQNVTHDQYKKMKTAWHEDIVHTSMYLSILGYTLAITP